MNQDDQMSQVSSVRASMIGDDADAKAAHANRKEKTPGMDREYFLEK